MLGSIMGSVAVGSFSSLVGMVTNLNNNSSNIYESLNGNTSNEDLMALLEQLGVEQPEGFDMSGMSAAQSDYSELQEYLSSQNKIEDQKLENKLEDQKAEIFLNKHYEFPTKDGKPDLTATPTLVDGAETAEQSAQRASWERNELVRVQEENLEASRNAEADPNSATGQLQALADDPKAYAELMNSEDGSKRYTELMEAAQKEQDIATIKQREAELKATYPPEMQDEIEGVTSQKISNYEDTVSTLKNSPEGVKLAEYEDMMSTYIANVRAQATGSMSDYTGIYNSRGTYTADV